MSGLSGVTAITAAGSHAIALKNDGTVWTWGWDGYGQLGVVTITQRNTPFNVGGL